MQIFKVHLNGEIHELKDRETPIKDLLNSEECFILNDDDNRIVYLWKGKESSVRSKFIGASKSQKMRGQVGMNYGVKTIDEDDEPPELLPLLENSATDGFAEEIIEDGEDVQFEVSEEKSYSEIMKKAEETKLQYDNVGPIYQGGAEDVGVMAGAGVAAPQYDLDEIIEELEKEDAPEGFEREMIIVGHQAYSVTEKIQTFLGKKKVEKIIDPIDSLDDGCFFAEDYKPRLLCLEGKIKAVELFKAKE